MKKLKKLERLTINGYQGNMKKARERMKKKGVKLWISDTIDDGDIG